MNTVGTQLRKTYRHQRFPIAELNRSLHLAHAGRRQLFDISLSFESFDGDATYGQSTPARVLMLDNGYEQTPMAIFVRDYHPAEDVHRISTSTPPISPLKKSSAYKSASSRCSKRYWSTTRRPWHTSRS